MAAIAAAESMYNLWEMIHQQEALDLDAMMRRLKDLSAYSLTHAEITEQREGVELLALGMFFGATSHPQLHKNQGRLQLLSQETVDYQGQSEMIEQEVAWRKGSNTGPKPAENPASLQLPLFRLDENNEMEI